MMKEKRDSGEWAGDPYEDLLSAFSLFDTEGTGELTMGQMMYVSKYKTGIASCCASNTTFYSYSSDLVSVDLLF